MIIDVDDERRSSDAVEVGDCNCIVLYELAENVDDDDNDDECNGRWRCELDVREVDGSCRKFTTLFCNGCFLEKNFNCPSIEDICNALRTKSPNTTRYSNDFVILW